MDFNNNLYWETYTKSCQVNLILIYTIHETQTELCPFSKKKKKMDHHKTVAIQHKYRAH